MLLCIKFQPDALYITIWSMEYVQEKFEDTKGVTRSVNRRMTDNTTAKRRNDKQQSTPHYTEK